MIQSCTKSIKKSEVKKHAGLISQVGEGAFLTWWNINQKMIYKRFRYRESQM